jgi:hypothetical protein
MTSNSRSLYTESNCADREAQIGSRDDAISKNFVTDLWTRVITKAIEDIVTVEVSRKLNRQIKEEELEYEESAKGFLFCDDYRFPIDDYLIDIPCPKCKIVHMLKISSAIGQHFECINCHHKVNKKYIGFKINDKQKIRDISLKDLLSIWGIENIDNFRENVLDKIEKMIRSKLKL